MIPSGRRIWDLGAGELCSMVYGWAVGQLSQEARRKFDYALTPDETAIIDDPRLPPELRGVRPPTWSDGTMPAKTVTMNVTAPKPAPQAATPRPKAPAKRTVQRPRTRPQRRR